MDKKIAFITAIFGDYENSCKPYVKQTIPADFICFTDNKNIVSNNWEIDLTPYHKTNPSAFDDGTYINSLKNNNHTFNVAKYYKQSFHNVPKLKDYDVIVWLDGTIQIIEEKTAEWIINQYEKHPIITWEHYIRFGSLKAEVTASIEDTNKYTSTFWLGQNQPYQDVQAQYQTYIKDGYNESLWFTIDSQRKNLGVWITCFIAFNNKNSKVHQFLDLWYLQTLKYSTQDQVSFSYAVQKSGLYPYTLPDQSLKGNADINTFYIKNGHGVLDDYYQDCKEVKCIVLYNAIRDRNIYTIKAFFEILPDFKFQTSSPLVLAIQQNYSQIVALLLHHVVDINKEAENGITALYQSVLNNNYNLTKQLLDYNADTETSLSSGSTPLFAASYFGYETIVELLIKHGANKNVQVQGVNMISAALHNNHTSTAIILAGSQDNFCQLIQHSEYETKYAELCGEHKVDL